MSAVRIAMWSGPRNISTAMMRSFGNRADTTVVDEPLYACYLQQTGAPHPGADEVIASQSTDWRAVVERLTGAIPNGHPVWYQKHMSHHLTDDVGRDWILALRSAFLIRSPREMLASLARVLEHPSIEDTGLPQQVALYDWLREHGHRPPIVDARDVLRDPARMLEALCHRLGLAYSSAMLQWPPGPRETDGVWAKHWYASVSNSSGFTAWQPRDADLPTRVQALLAPCERLYERLYDDRIQ